MKGIYSITNLINGKKYIGQSKNIEDRWSQHQTAAFSQNLKLRNKCPKFYAALRKYGQTNFQMSILESGDSFSRDELNEKRDFWIKYYDTVLSGYNIESGGYGGGLESSEAKQKSIISKVNHGSVIPIVNIETNTFFPSLLSACKWAGLKSTNRMSKYLGGDYTIESIGIVPETGQKATWRCPTDQEIEQFCSVFADPIRKEEPNGFTGNCKYYGSFRNQAN